MCGWMNECVSDEMIVQVNEKNLCMQINTCKVLNRWMNEWMNEWDAYTHISSYQWSEIGFCLWTWSKLHSSFNETCGV